MTNNIDGERLGVNIIIEREKVKNKDIFIASSPDINVIAEGNTIDEAKEKFLEGAIIHLKTFPEERKCLEDREESELEMPMLARVFL